MQRVSQGCPNIILWLRTFLAITQSLFCCACGQLTVRIRQFILCMDPKSVSRTEHCCI
ncbi:hypothetical protein BDV28DRAFT_125921 [Aspergillus coremiiformis]|uniref:Uncharacterized protein n=1 Tax=Aspergillus coremiiformis TaxID=138285 RepID=A0A5N6ZH10_9EURO|nr:hypothetical protein BDV28DRAFT_125921 [Aspergillus coremiiformis]